MIIQAKQSVQALIWDALPRRDIAHIIAISQTARTATALIRA